MSLKLADIESAGRMIVKWGGSTYTGEESNGKMSPGWLLETQSEGLITRMDEKTSLMRDATFIKMTSRKHSLDYLYIDPVMQSMTTDGGMFKGSMTEDLIESIPKFARRTLNTRPYVAYSFTSKQFIKENVEKEGFLPKFEGMLAEACGIKTESIGIYSREDSGSDAGYGDYDGLFAQLEKVAALTDEDEIAQNGRGYYGVIDTADAEVSILEQIMNMITTFAAQKGKIAKAKLYTSTILKGMILIEASKRETDLGDKVILNGTDITIFGVPVEEADFINNPANGFNEKVVLCDPKAAVFGVLWDMESESTYEHNMKGYLSSVDIEFDSGMIHPKDIMYADITNGQIFGAVKNTSGASVTLKPQNNETSADITIANNETNTRVPVGKYTNGDATVTVTKGKTVTIAASE